MGSVGSLWPPRLRREDLVPGRHTGTRLEPQRWWVPWDLPGSLDDQNEDRISRRTGCGAVDGNAILLLKFSGLERSHQTHQSTDPAAGHVLGRSNPPSAAIHLVQF